MDQDTQDLGEMRRIVRDLDISPYERRAYEGAIKIAEDYWRELHRENYLGAVAARDQQHQEFIGAVQGYRKQAEDLLSRVGVGRTTPQEARTWLRDALAAHSRLLEQHEAINHSEESLAEFEAMTPDQYQAHMRNRLPMAMVNSPAPSFRTAVYQFMNKE